MRFEIGALITEHYRLVRRLGGGSYGEVWLAHNMLADIDVAIKFYKTLDTNGIDEFRKEFAFAYKLNHPNLLHLNHFDIYDNYPYLVMPYCVNGSAALQIGNLSENGIWCFIRDVASGLSYLHKQTPPIIHHDIKPDNILIGEDGQYMISDFGITDKMTVSGVDKNDKLESTGTLAYMGPENFHNNPLITPSSDIWSLGMSVYELANGDVLWNGLGGCAQINGSTYENLPPKYSYRLNSLIEKCLLQNPSSRPSADELYNIAVDALSDSYDSNRIKSNIISTNVPSHRYEQTISYQQNIETPLSIKNIDAKYPSKNNQFRRSSFLTVKTFSLILICLIVVFGIGMGVMSFVESIEEDNRYMKCRTIDDFEKFISDYPDSKHITDVNRKIEHMKKPSKVELPIERIDDEQPFVSEEKKSYKQVYGDWAPQPVTKKTQPPIGNNKDDVSIDEAIKKTETPKHSQTQNQEEIDFRKCKTKGDFLLFKKKYKNSKYLKEAERRIREFEKEESKEPDVSTDSYYFF